MAALFSNLRHRPLWQVCGLGLAVGLLVSVPLARRHPLAGWWGLGIGEVVVLGQDVGGSNTDTIFTLKVKPGSTRITQIPRDSYINPDGFGAMKINGLLRRGGPEAVERELTRLMNRPVRHHVVVSLQTLPLLANLVGGIEVDVPKRLYYVDRSQDLVIDLQPGRQVLSGKALEGFLRWRNDGYGDFGRLERQQLALKGLANRLRQPQNLLKLPLLLGVVRTQVQTDLNPLQMAGLATGLISTDLDAHRLQARPFSRGGISYLETTWPN
jgi:LCP family protein required for cell wall assembly